MTAPRELVAIALGSNLGDRAGHLAFAQAAIAALPDTRVVAVSTLEETAPLGPVPQGHYLNQMIAAETALAPRPLLAALQAIEREAGRIRGERWGPRTLDLDIVRFGDRRVADADLEIPHPQLPHRDFWQRELAELDRLLATPPARPQAGAEAAAR